MTRATGQYLICLTGNIATGKSTVAAMLAELGATVIDADQVTHQVLDQDSTVYERIVAAFGPGVVVAGGEIDRQSLGQIVFNDPAALRRLEEIVHPAVGAQVRQRIERAEAAVVVIEAIKLIEAGWHHICQALWVTDCSREQQIARLVGERGFDREEAKRRIDAQPPQALKIALADVVIDTSGDLQETRRQVNVAWSRIGEDHEHNASVSRC